MGTVIDRVDQRRLLVLCQFASAVAVLLLLFVRSETTAWIAVLTYGLLAATKAFSTPTANTILPRIVSPSELLTANAAISSLWGVMLALGPRSAGLPRLPPPRTSASSSQVSPLPSRVGCSPRSTRVQ